jgi:hypothetical protein
MFYGIKSGVSIDSFKVRLPTRALSVSLTVTVNDRYGHAYSRSECIQQWCTLKEGLIETAKFLRANGLVPNVPSCAYDVPNVPSCAYDVPNVPNVPNVPSCAYDVPSCAYDVPMMCL